MLENLRVKSVILPCLKKYESTVLAPINLIIINEPL